jgi:hypothetical protein
VTARIAFTLTAIIGSFYATYGLFTSSLDLGIGVAVAAAGIVGYGFTGYGE